MVVQRFMPHVRDIKEARQALQKLWFRMDKQMNGIEGGSQYEILVKDSGTTGDYSWGTELDQVVIGGNVAAAATFTTCTVTTITDSTVSLTAGVITGTWADLGSVTTVDINGGTVDGTIIGGATPAAVSGTAGVFDDLTVNAISAAGEQIALDINTVESSDQNAKGWHMDAVTASANAYGGYISVVTGNQCFGIYSHGVTSAGTGVTNGIYLNSVTNTGTEKSRGIFVGSIDSDNNDAFGLYINSVTAGAGKFEYGVYVNDTGSINYFGGTVYVGTFTAPGTPTRIFGKGTTNDGTTDIFTGHDSDGTEVFAVDTDGEMESRTAHIGAAATNYTQFEADGTMVFNGTATVWKDINLGSAQLQLPAASAPSTDTFTDNLGADTDIATLAFSVGDKIGGTLEIQHDYKEGSDFTPHIHFQCDAAPTGTDYVKWQMDYTIVRDNTTMAPVTSIVIETAVDTQYEQLRSNWAAITGTGIQIGDQFSFKLTRIAAAGDAYAGDVKLKTVGLHYEIDTIGSRTIAVK